MLMFKRLLNGLKLRRAKWFKVISKLGVGLAATTQEGDDTAPRRDPTGPQEDND